MTKSKCYKAESLVNKYMLGSLAVGAIPIPLVDMAALTGLQLKMLHHLADLYGIEFSKERSKVLIASLLGAGIPLSFSRDLARLVKGVPVYGTATSIVSMSILGSTATYAIGKIFIQHFESGGTFLTFDPQKVRDYYIPITENKPSFWNRFRFKKSAEA